MKIKLISIYLYPYIHVVVSRLYIKSLIVYLQGVPLRLRPASNPQQMKKPSTEFKAYDYTTADYSEFAPPEPPKSHKHGRKYGGGNKVNNV